MMFWASSETDSLTGNAVSAASKIVTPALNDALAASSLSDFDAEIRYVPIVMPPASVARYPARSRLRKKLRIYECCPQLDYSVFAASNTGANVRCFIQGIKEAASHLSKLGATVAQVEEFERILDDLQCNIKSDD